jgi:hypothetical protein
MFGAGEPNFETSRRSSCRESPTSQAYEGKRPMSEGEFPTFGLTIS